MTLIQTIFFLPLRSFLIFQLVFKFMQLPCTIFYKLISLNNRYSDVNVCRVGGCLRKSIFVKDLQRWGIIGNVRKQKEHFRNIKFDHDLRRIVKKRVIDGKQSSTSTKVKPMGALKLLVCYVKVIMVVVDHCNTFIRVVAIWSRVLHHHISLFHSSGICYFSVQMKKYYSNMHRWK